VLLFELPIATQIEKLLNRAPVVLVAHLKWRDSLVRQATMACLALLFEPPIANQVEMLVKQAHVVLVARLKWQN